MDITAVKVGGILYEVETIFNLYDGKDELDGWICYDESKIKLEAKLSNQLRRVVLWHEIIHAILTHAGYTKHSEQMIEALSHGIVMVLRDNPQLKEGIMKDDRTNEMVHQTNSTANLCNNLFGE